jgi:hypothetical protein
MDRSTFDAYLSCFNRRDYDGLLRFWSEDFTVAFAGYTFRGARDFIGFYRFLHHYVAESIAVDEFLSNDRLVVLEARVRLEGRVNLTPEILKTAGYERIVPVPVGQVVEIPQFIHYHLEGGKFASVVCAISAEPRVL